MLKNVSYIMIIINRYLIKEMVEKERKKMCRQQKIDSFLKKFSKLIAFTGIVLLIYLSLRVSFCYAKEDAITRIINDTERSARNTYKVAQIIKSLEKAGMEQIDVLIKESGILQNGKYKGFFRKDNDKHFDYVDIKKYKKTGYATFYSEKDPGNNINTATGVKFNENKKTCALPDAMLPIVINVTNLENGKEMKIICNDRGITAKRFKYEKHRRVVDLSKAAAFHLDEKFHKKGKVKVEISIDKMQTLAMRLILYKNIINNKRKLITI